MDTKDPCDAYVERELASMHGRTPKTAEYLMRTAWSAGFVAALEQLRGKRAKPAKTRASAPVQEGREPVARQTFRPKELPMNPMQEAMRPFSDLSGGEQEPQGGMSEELPPLPEPVSNLHGDVFSPNQMRDYARRAILAAAGGRK